MGWTTSTLREVADFCRDQADKGEGQGLPVLWQYLTKEHVAPDADPREWRAFVQQYEGSFADHLTREGRDMWNQRDLVEEDIANANRDYDS